MLWMGQIATEFVQMHFKNKDPAGSKFITANIYTGEPMIFLTDPKVFLLFYLIKLSFRCKHIQ